MFLDIFVLDYSLFYLDQERSLYPTVSPVTSSTFQRLVNKFDFFSYLRGRDADQSLLNTYKVSQKYSKYGNFLEEMNE